MEIRNVVHRGLRRFIERNDTSGLPAGAIEKVRNIVTFLLDMENPEELRALPHWKPHRLTGDRRHTWSLTVTRNRRVTFSIDQVEHQIVDLNFEDYH